MPRKRMIEIHQLAQRIEAELESGRADDADLSDEQVDRVAGLLRPAPAIDQGQVARTAIRALRRTVRGATAGAMMPAFMQAAGAAGMAS
ncbi:hypothetical protein ACWD6N_12170 [Micromonospora sp. NPDC005163]